MTIESLIILNCQNEVVYKYTSRGYDNNRIERKLNEKVRNIYTILILIEI